MYVKYNYVHHTAAVWKFTKHPGHSGTQHCMQMCLVFHVHAASWHAFALRLCGEPSAKFMADDLILGQGVIRSRAAPTLNQGFVWGQGPLPGTLFSPQHRWGALEQTLNPKRSEWMSGTANLLSVTFPSICVCSFAHLKFYVFRIKKGN